jgi:hypothetical protein
VYQEAKQGYTNMREIQIFGGAIGFMDPEICAIDANNYAKKHKLRIVKAKHSVVKDGTKYAHWLTVVFDTE